MARGVWAGRTRTTCQDPLLANSHPPPATPPWYGQDYDDDYVLEYARRHEGLILSNDMFRDHADKVLGHGNRAIRAGLVMGTGPGWLGTRHAAHETCCS